MPPRPPTSTLFPYTTLFRSQPERDAGIPRVDQAPLTFDEDDVGVLRRLEHQPFRRTGDEVGHHRDSPPSDEDARLPGGDEPHALAALDPGVPQLALRGHLPDV